MVSEHHGNQSPQEPLDHVMPHYRAVEHHAVNHYGTPKPHD